MIEIFIPYKLKSIANICENPFVKSKRLKKEKKYVFFFLKPLINFDILSSPIIVTLTRISSRMLDAEDNLPFAFKSIRDSISEILVTDKPRGHGDNDQRIVWKYNQEKGKLSGIKISIKSYTENSL